MTTGLKSGKKYTWRDQIDNLEYLIAFIRKNFNLNEPTDDQESSTQLATVVTLTKGIETQEKEAEGSVE